MDQSVLPKFPTTKIKTIMKSSQNVDQVGSVGVFAMTRSAEAFVKLLMKSVKENSNTKNETTYSDIANLVAENSMFDFLEDSIPKKIKVSEWKKLMEEKRNRDELDSSDESEEEASEEER